MIKSLSKSIDRLPPHDNSAEQGVLGCALLDPNQVMSEIVSKVKDKDIFYDLRHQSIYESLEAMFNLRQPIDLITIQSWMRDCGELEQCGGIAYLSQLQDAVPSAANLSYYLDRIREKHLLRRMIATCSGVVGKVYDYEGDVESLVDEVEKEVMMIRGSTVSHKIQTPATLVDECITEIEYRFNNKGVVTGIETGLVDLDNMTNGLQPSDFIIIAARPSCGKTALMGNFIEQAAVMSRIPCGVFSLEMTAKQLMMRAFSAGARVNIHHLNKGELSENDFSKLTGQAGRLKGAPIYIDDESGLSIMQLRARARRMVQQFGIKIFFIDYLQLLNSSSKKAEKDRRVEVGEVSKGLKQIAKEFNVPVVALCQLNREMEKQKGRMPKLSDLRESGDLEQDADIVGLLYKPNAGKDDEEVETDPCDGEPVNLLIAKARNGPTGEVRMTFLKPYVRFEQASRFSNEDVP